MLQCFNASMKNARMRECLLVVIPQFSNDNDQAKIEGFFFVSFVPLWFQ